MYPKEEFPSIDGDELDKSNSPKKFKKKDGIK